MPYEILEWKLYSDDTTDHTTVTNLISFDDDTLKTAIFLVEITNENTGDYTINDIFIESNSTNSNFVKIYTNAGSLSEGQRYLQVDKDGKWYYTYNIPLTQPNNNYLIGTSNKTDPTAADFKFTNKNNNYDIKYNGAYTNTIKSWSR
jgi:hypothetical protein